MSSDSDYTCLVRRHTHKRKKIVISDSDSSDDSFILQNRRKKKIYRVISEGESSSDDSDVPKPVIRRQNHRVISEDECNFDSSTSEASQSSQSDSSTSEWQTDWTSSDELNEDSKKYKAKRKVLSKTKRNDAGKPGPSSNADVHSDSSDEHLEKCPICLLPFRKQQVGTPSACDHCFCLECLLEWSKNINTCPVDRQSFTAIHVRDNFGGEIIKHVPVEIVPRIETQAQDDPTFCEVCHQSDREDRMLLCDNCDRGYHLECLTPPMTAVPIEEWFCPECTNRTNDRVFVTDFLPTLMMTRRPSRRVLQFDNNSGLGIFRRIFPHIRNIDDDHMYIPASLRNRAREQVRDEAPTPADIPEQFVDPNLPSTSSGLESIGDNSRSRSPNTSLEGNVSSRSNTKSKKKTTKKKKRKLVKNSKKRGGDKSVVREVRITELNDDGEEEEIVTYVKVASSTSRRKCKKRTKKTRKVYR